MYQRQKKNAIKQAESLPSLFSCLNPFDYRNVKRIAKRFAGLLEADPVLAPIGKVLGLVPLESNACHFAKYNYKIVI